MSKISNFLELEILDQIFGAQAYTAPATLYIAACTASVSDTDTGSTITEPVGGAYARASVTNNKTNWATAASGAVDNAAEIAFTQATGSWGTIVDFAVCDASSAGNVLWYGTLDTSKAVGNGDTLKFAVGDLNFTLD